MASDGSKEMGVRDEVETRAFDALIAPAREPRLDETQATALKARILSAAVDARPPKSNVVAFEPRRRPQTQVVRTAKPAIGWGAVTGAALAASLVLGIAAGTLVSGDELGTSMLQVASQAVGLNDTGEGELFAGLMNDSVETLF